MKKHRVNTTISQKHHEILMEYTGKYGTQQSVLEHALESWENNSDPDFEISPELEIWMQLYKIKDLIAILPKDYTRTLFETTDMDKVEKYFEKEKPVEFAIEWYYNQPLKECTLPEVIQGVIINLKMQTLPDSVNYREYDDHYTINITHGLGINGSHAIVIMNESVFKSYEAKFESQFSKRSVFFKIFKG